MSHSTTSLPPASTVTSDSTVTARQLARDVATVTEETTSNEAIRMFNADKSLNCLAVVSHEGYVLGVLRSLDLLRRGNEEFFHELLGRQSCTRIMDPQPLVFDVNTPLLEMSAAVSNLNDRQLVDGFFVTQERVCIGAGRMTDLIKAVTEQQILFARYANPLTLLPGNVPIERHIYHCLHDIAPFVVGYFDLDNFKGFNDVYGYSDGDDVIRLAAQALTAAIDTQKDFLGHIGGDDFVTVLRSEDWEQRIQVALDKFDEDVMALYRPEHIAAGGLVTKNRQGVEVFHPLVSLSAGLLRIAPGDFETPAEISNRLVDAKKLAKQTPGSSYFIDRRVVG